jgi:hypothetical protein
MLSLEAIVQTSAFVFQNTCIHPATRKLLRGKRPLHATSASSATTVTSAPSTTEEAAVKQEPSESSVVVPSYVGPKPSQPPPEAPRGLQHKRKRRIVVGNVSRWIDCDQREDLSTHKVSPTSVTWDRCCDFENIFAKKIGGKNWRFCSKYW